MRQDHIVTQTEEMRGNLQQSPTPKDVRWSDSSNDGRNVRQQLISGYTVLNLQRRESDSGMCDDITWKGKTSKRAIISLFSCCCNCHETACDCGTKWQQFREAVCVYNDDSFYHIVPHFSLLLSMDNKCVTKQSRCDIIRHDVQLVCGYAGFL